MRDHLSDSRNKQKVDYFPGGDESGRGCACDVDKTCDDDRYPCNCDVNDDKWREDSGYITNKRQLPLTSFRAGETGRDRESH